MVILHKHLARTNESVVSGTPGVGGWDKSGNWSNGVRVQRTGDANMVNAFLKKMENHATAEATRLGKSNHGKLRLIGIAIGIVVVILLALWMAYHP